MRQVAPRVSRPARPSRDGCSRCALPAALGSCVTMTIVLPSSRFSRSSRSRISSAVARSRSPVGSSATMSVGSVMSARAIATRCCWPPESSFGKWSMRSASPTSASAVVDALAPLAPRESGEQQRQLDVLERGQHRHQVVELEDEADVAPRATRRARPRRAAAMSTPPTRISPADRLVDAGDQVEQRRSCPSPTAPSARRSRRRRRRG